MIRLWPVIHVRNTDLALENAQKAVDCGAYGVFLIHMDGKDDLLGPIGALIRAHHPTLRLGINYLSMNPEAALERSLAFGFDATWVDKSGVSSEEVTPQALAMQQRLIRVPRHELFASIAFKYQPVDSNPGKAAARALELKFIPTTSGEATGVAPNVSKLKIIREHIGEQARLALASGVDTVNIGEFAPFLTDVLVSTGISSDFYTFDGEKMKLLASTLRADRCFKNNAK